ncbi:hypothetical protein [Devosia sp. MC521]|uniref:hypothetical protein n=1 Tax=Devosia sp. MC521 TaxID=2759954 RepID=UPI0015FB7BF8|nr:hypothetical protein [Devosia sp. MC521]MBJ6986897.1 hypothetical protein [Devosia sp. MC521]QMW63923.1 hypothetical protein H4N61_06295 [Devosia sp. MC521]
MTDKANALSQLADKLSYRVENPSAWPEGFDQGGSDLFREAATTIRAFATASNPLQAVVDRFPGGEAAFNAVLQCPHEIDAEKVVLKIDHSRPGNAIAQLHARLSALKTTPAPVSEATHRHKKRGTEYVLIGEGKMQAETWVDMFEGGVLSVDDEEVAIYRSATDPTEIWVRPLEEFRDGRFENLTTSTGGELNG